MRTTTISDLPEDVLLEIFFRVPLTSLKPMRSICKKWNALSKTQIIGKARKQVIGLMHSRVCLMKLDLQEIRNEGNGLVDPYVMEISVFNKVKISEVFHCEGLLLCVTNYRSKLLVWNPYLGQTRWIQPINYAGYNGDVFALGYDKNNRNHKILRILNGGYPVGLEIYDFSSSSWRFLAVNPDYEIHYHDKIYSSSSLRGLAFNPDWDIHSYRNCLSLKGNTYFSALTSSKDLQKYEVLERFLLCFDFTAERFGPRLSLPYQNSSFNVCVKDEQLALLYIFHDIITWKVIDTNIWVTNRIEPNAVSWSKFWEADAKQLAGFPDDFEADWFFIDEEKKAAVIFGFDEDGMYKTGYIVGIDGYFKSVNIEGNTLDLDVISSYVPSLVQMQTNQDITN